MDQLICEDLVIGRSSQSTLSYTKGFSESGNSDGRHGFHELQQELKATNERQDGWTGILHQVSQFPIDQVFVPTEYLPAE